MKSTKTVTTKNLSQDLDFLLEDGSTLVSASEYLRAANDVPNYTAIQQIIQAVGNVDAPVPFIDETPAPIDAIMPEPTDTPVTATDTHFVDAGNNTDPTHFVDVMTAYSDAVANGTEDSFNYNADITDPTNFVDVMIAYSDAVANGTLDSFVWPQPHNPEPVVDDTTETIVEPDTTDAKPSDDTLIVPNDNDDNISPVVCQIFPNDIICGTEGNDTIQDFSNETVYGGGGDDTITRGTHTIFGGRGTIVVGSNNEIHGDEGNDTIVSGENDQVFGDAGHDNINIAAGTVASGGDGNDTIFSGGYLYTGASTGSVRMYGNAGDDLLDITPASQYNQRTIRADTLDGGDGNDTIHGGLGDDALTGGDGADIFIFNPEADYNSSAFWAGSDRPLSYAPNFNATITDFDAGVDKIELGRIFTDEGGGTNSPFPDAHRIGSREATLNDIQWMIDHAETTTVDGYHATILHMPGGADNSTITLVDVNPNQLSTSDFIFG